MTDTVPSRGSLLCGALLLLCLSAVSFFPDAALESPGDDNRNDSISYARQIIQDSFPLPDNRARSNGIPSVRNARMYCCIAQPWFVSFFPAPFAVNSHIADIQVPQSLAVFQPATRSPPA